MAIGSVSFVVAAALYAAGWVLVATTLPRTTSDPASSLPGAATVGITLATLQAVSQLFLPGQIERASELYGGLAATIATLGWFFFMGRAMAVSFVLDAAVHDHFGGTAKAVLSLPVLRAIPDELEEAASIDGASRLGFFWRILLPLSMPGLVTVGVLAFIGSWNGYLLPLLVISTGSLPQELWPLPLGVTQFSTQYSQDTGAVLAYTSLAMIPALAFFLFAEKRIVGGLTGAVKG